MDGTTGSNNSPNRTTGSASASATGSKSSSSSSSSSTGNRFTPSRPERWKYWVSTVAAVIDPTLPSPSRSADGVGVNHHPGIPGSNPGSNDNKNTSTNNTTSTNTSTTNTSTSTDHGDDDPPHGSSVSYVPPSFTSLVSPVVPTTTITNTTTYTTTKNELDHQHHQSPTITSHEQVLIFDDSSSNNNDNNVEDRPEDDSKDTIYNSTNNYNSSIGPTNEDIGAAAGACGGGGTTTGSSTAMNRDTTHTTTTTNTTGSADQKITNDTKNTLDETTTTTTATATPSTTASNSRASVSLFPATQLRLSTWTQQATNAMLQATATATTSPTGTVATAAALFRRPPPQSQQQQSTSVVAAHDNNNNNKNTASTAITTPTTTTTTTGNDSRHVQMMTMPDLAMDGDEKKDDVVVATAEEQYDTTVTRGGSDQGDDALHPHTHSTTTQQQPPSHRVHDDTPPDPTIVVPTNESLADHATKQDDANILSPPPPPAKTLSFGSTMRFSSLPPWNFSVSAAAAAMPHAPRRNDVFRGRYSMTSSSTITTTNNNLFESAPTTTTTPPPASLENQSVRIGKLAATSDHWNQLSSRLQPHEYILLLGRGMLGVNLKQCYKLHQGVYVDYLVPHGSADRSKLVFVGDIITTVAQTDCLKNGTIATVPSIIATTPRPVHVTFCTSGCFSIPNSNSSRDPHPSMNYLDIAVALLHISATTTATTTTTTTTIPPLDDTASVAVGGHDPKDDPTTTTNPTSEDVTERTTVSDETMGTEDSMSLVQPTSFDLLNHDTLGDDIIRPDHCRIPDLITTKFDIDHLLHPPCPPKSICRSYMAQVAQRSIDPVVFTVDYVTATYHCSTNVRCVLQNAFIVCLADRRRLAFIHRFIERHQEDRTKEQAVPTHYENIVPLTPVVKKWNVLLSLFLEMYHFVDLYDLVPVSKQRDMVTRIAYKYFLPTIHNETKQVQSPPFDFHTIVSDAAIRKLELALKTHSTADQKYPRSIFMDFQQATFTLLTESVFLPFVISNDCARMRAYLRHTAPYVNVPISAVLSATVSGTDVACAPSSPLKVHAQNYLTYCLVYLLCMMEQEEFGENDDLLLDQGEEGSVGRGARVENAASAICAAIRIKRQILPTLSRAQQQWEEHGADRNYDDTNISLNELVTTLLVQLEQIWEIYVAPGIGSLVEGPNPTTAVQSLQMLRSALMGLQQQCKGCNNYQSVLGVLFDSTLFEHLNNLANELIHDYAVRLYPRFRVHKFHEWACDEMMQEHLKQYGETDNNHTDSTFLARIIPAMSSGCVKRLLRKAKFPVGITPHQPSHDKRDCVTRDDDDNLIAEEPHCNADCAIVFGTRIDTIDATTGSATILTMDNICRYSCQSVRENRNSSNLNDRLMPEEIPVTLESYAYVPISRQKPFQSMQVVDGCPTDHWEISLVNFMLPHADAASQSDEASSIYGVSLVLQYRENPSNNITIPSELSIQPQLADATDTSPMSTFDEDEKDRDASDAMNWFDRMKKQQEKSLIDDPSNASFSIGLALVCQKNNILAMRETLSLLLQNFTSQPSDQSPTTTNILALVNQLGNHTNPNIESSTDSLHEFLRPYLSRGSRPWIERPIGSQGDEFLNHAGQQLIQCLPPIPMALMFITALLEQKIVITSNRRSILLSVTTALQHLLHPLQWCHLILAHVPAALASDLLQYPAPFILGLPSSDPGITEMLRELPSDITLIDLDIGRVILAPSFGHDSEFGRRPAPTTTNAGPESNPATSHAEKNVRILRSQVLYLSQCLGSIFGTHLYPSTWCCDDPVETNSISGLSSALSCQFDTLRYICQNFIEELLAGTTSCCYWLEEANVGAVGSTTTPSSTVATVLFDEDQFFHIKDARYRFGHTPLFPKSWIKDGAMNHMSNVITTAATTSTTETTDCRTESSPSCALSNNNRHHLALSMNEFDYVVELLLRCQSMNVYIGTRPRHDMAYFTESS